MCNKNCWECELEGCPYTLDISDELDQDAFKKMSREDKQRYFHRRWARTEHGKQKMRELQRKWIAENRDHFNMIHARSEWIRSNERRKGVRPTEKEVEEWSIRYAEKMRRKKGDKCLKL